MILGGGSIALMIMLCTWGCWHAKPGDLCKKPYGKWCALFPMSTSLPRLYLRFMSGPCMRGKPSALERLAFMSAMVAIDTVLRWCVGPLSAATAGMWLCRR
eukprot:COSAG05_NODE_628_length_8241_cov_5.614468_7_plen_101_part_00